MVLGSNDNRKGFDRQCEWCARDGVPLVKRIAFWLVVLWAVFIAIYLNVPPSAMAAPAVVQTGKYIANGVSNNNVVLNASPTNTNVVTVIVQGQNTSPTSVKDSNNVSLTLEASNSQGAARHISLYDYTVSGSPTATYTCTINGASSCEYIGAIEISGVGLSQSHYLNSSGTTSTPTSGSLTPTLSGDILWCGTTANVNETIAISNSASLAAVLAIAANPSANASYATGNNTSSTCTGSGSGSWAIVFANYTIPAAVSPCFLQLSPCMPVPFGYIDLRPRWLRVTT